MGWSWHHSGGGIRQWIGIHNQRANNIWTKKSAKHMVDISVYLNIPEKYKWTALTNWTVLDEKISHELPRGGCVCNFGRWDCRKETCESCNMINPWRIPWKSLDISHDAVEWLTCCAVLSNCNDQNSDCMVAGRSIADVRQQCHPSVGAGGNLLQSNEGFLACAWP